MFQHLVDFSLKNKAAVLALTAIVAVWGWLSFRDLTVEAFPDPTETQVQVITLYPGQPAEEVERQLGLPLERALNGIPQLSRLRNLSLFGLSYVTLTFNDGIDGLWARPQVLERLREADLPDGIVPQLGPYATPIGEVYRYTLVGAGGDPMKLRTLQDWVVRPAFLRVNGVADVVSIRRAPAGDPRAARPLTPRGARPHPGLAGAGHQERQRERLGRRARARGRAAGHPQRGPLHHRRGSQGGAAGHRGGHAGLPQGRGHRHRGLGAAPGRGQPQRPDGHRAGHRADAPRREPLGGAGAHPRARCTTSTTASPATA